MKRVKSAKGFEFRRLLLLVLAGVLLLGTLAACTGDNAPEGSVAQIPEAALVILDTNDQQSVTNAGFAADSEDAYAAYAAKWAVDEQENFEIQNFPADISAHNTLQFSMKLESTDEARIMFYFGSENAETEEADYYSYTMVVKPGEWKDYTVDMSKVIAYGQPLGFDRLTEISIRTKGWRNHAEAGSILRFGHMYLTGEPVVLEVYNPTQEAVTEYPHFTVDAINAAAELAVAPTGWPRFDEGKGLDNHLNNYPAEKCTNALYYLTLAVRYNEMDENAEPLYASNGVLCKDAVISLLEFFLEGGNEPAASVGCFWGHAVMANSLYLIKNTECIYSELSQDTKDRMDWMMKALAIAGNWGYNDANNYSTGFDLCGNFGKTWNMNYQNTYLSIMLTASMYFGNEELDEILVNFDYDTYMDKFREYDFINIIYTWETAGKTLMETGAMADGYGPVLQDVYSGTTDGSQVGDSGGTGKGVKIPFQYTAKMPDGTNEVLTLKDEDFAYKLFVYLTSKTYSGTVQSSFGQPGDEDYCFIYGDVMGKETDETTGAEYEVYAERRSPFEGRLGMYSELQAKDASGYRSSLTYAYDSFEILTGVYTNMKLFGGWDSSTEEMQALDDQIYVGNEDMLFRMEYGYQGYNSGTRAEQNEQTYEYRGVWFVKDIWKNVICGWDSNTQVKGEVAIPDLPDALPMGGVIKAPEGALVATPLTGGKFVEAAYTTFGAMQTGSVAFDMVIGNNVATDGSQQYDAVIAIMSKGTRETWNNMEMSIQLQEQLVNIRSGSSYARTGFYFEKNYRFHTEITFDAQKREYSVKIQQIYPSLGEIYECNNIPFRSSGDIMGYVDSIAVLQQNTSSDLWLENVYVNGELIEGTDVKYETTEAIEVKDVESPDTMIRVHRDISKDFTDFTKPYTIGYTSRETVVIMASDELSELESLAYYVSKTPLSEEEVKALDGWIELERDLDCFKIEPYTNYYVYAKSSDSEGNVGYVSKCVMYDPEIPLITGVIHGMTYCEEQTITIADKFLASVQINDEYVKLGPGGTYTLKKDDATQYIVATDYAGNIRRFKVRISDTVLTDKIIIDGNDDTTITKTGMTVTEDVTYGDNLYAGKWTVDNGNLKIKGAEGNLTDYTTLNMAIRIDPAAAIGDCNVLLVFASENNAEGKMQYYQKPLTLKPGRWYDLTIGLGNFSKTRSPSWQDIKNVRLYVYGWSGTNVPAGSDVYIGHMSLTARGENRVHAKDHTTAWVLSETDTTKHDLTYSCCNYIGGTEPHVKAENSDICTVCGVDMTTKLEITSGGKIWNTVASKDAATAFTSDTDVVIHAGDYGYGVEKLEYATSASYVEDMSALNWQEVDNDYVLELPESDEPVYIYARVTDGNGNVTYVSTEPMISDDVMPVIAGAENGVIYCYPPTITITEQYLSKVTVGGNEVTLTNGTYTFNPDCGTKKVIVTDKAGNTTTITVTVSDTSLEDLLLLESDTLTVSTKYAEYYLLGQNNTTSTDVSGYKTLSFRILVPEDAGNTVRVRLSQWSHTYYEWVVNVTPGAWQTVELDIHDPQIVASTMNLTKLRFFAFIANGGAANIKQGSTVQLADVCLKEERVHTYNQEIIGDTHRVDENEVENCTNGLDYYVSCVCGENGTEIFEGPKGKNHLSTEFTYKVNPDNTKQHFKYYACCEELVCVEAHSCAANTTQFAKVKCDYCGEEFEDWLDNTAPVISGIEDGKVYVGELPVMTVTDDIKLEKVTVNGIAVAIRNGEVQYTFVTDDAEQTVVAEDAAGNQTVYTITVWEKSSLVDPDEAGASLGSIWDDWSTFVSGSSKLGERANPQIATVDGNQVTKLSSRNNNSSIARVQKNIDVNEIDNLTVEFDFKTYDTKQDSTGADDLRKQLYVLHMTEGKNKLNAASTLAGKTSFFAGRAADWQSVRIEMKVTDATDGTKQVIGTAYALVNGSWTAVDGYNNVTIFTGTDGILKLNFAAYVTNNSSYALVDNVNIYTVKKEAHVHIFDQKVENDVHRVDMDEKHTCVNGLDYYISCVCGANGTETFEGPKSETHASEEFTYTVDPENTKQHIKTHACCGVEVERAVHTAADDKTSGTCQYCRAEFDFAAPVISGIENGKVYVDILEKPTMTVTDDVQLAKVTVDGVELTITDGSVKYTFVGRIEPYNIMAEDASGNKVYYTITVQKTNVILNTDFSNVTTGVPTSGNGIWDEWSTYVSGSSKLGERSRVRFLDEDGTRLTKLTSNAGNSAIARAHKYIDVSKLDNLAIQFDFKTYDTKQDSTAADDLRKQLYVLHMTEGRNQLSSASTLAGKTSFFAGRSADWETIKIELSIAAGENGARVVTGTAYALENGSWVAVNGYSNVTITTGTDGILKLNFAAYVTNNSSYAYVDNLKIYSIAKPHEHVFDQQIAEDSHRVDMSETATCVKGLTYYVSCECGANGTETFEDAKNAENHATIEFAYEYKDEEQHTKMHKCCGVEVAEEAHSCESNTTPGATVMCDLCGAEFIEWLDNTAPEISGIENGKVYVAETPTMTVTDNVHLAKVTVDGVELTITDGAVKFTFPAKDGAYAIVAVDGAGNQSYYTIIVQKTNIIVNTDFSNVTTGVPTSGNGIWDEWSTYKSGSTKLGERSRVRFLDEDGTRLTKLTSDGNNSSIPRAHKYIDVSELDNLVIQFDFKTNDTDTGTGADSLRKQLYVLHCTDNRNQLHAAATLAGKTSFFAGRSADWKTIKIELSIAAGENGARVVTGTAYALENGSWVAVDSYGSQTITTGTDGILKLNFAAYVSNKNSYAYVDNLKIYSIVKPHEHVFDQQIAEDAHRVDAAEVATCVKGLTYYVSCECGEKSSETFEGPKGETHEGAEVTYAADPENAQQHIKTYACCGAEEKENHTSADEGTDVCQHCGTALTESADTATE